MDGTGRILVVEDDSQVAEIIYWNLLAAGYAVTIAADGLAALRAFEEEPPALVTVDLMLPSVSGFRLVELFKRERPRTPVLVVTALAFEEADETARAGADDFITKPFDPQVLVQKVCYFLHPSPAPTTGASLPSDRLRPLEAVSERRRRRSLTVLSA